MQRTMWVVLVVLGAGIVVVAYAAVVASGRASRAEERRHGLLFQVRPEVEDANRPSIIVPGGGKGGGALGGADEQVDPVKVVGSCAFCPCGERVEMPAAVTAGTDAALVRCPECIRLIRIPGGRSGRHKPEDGGKE